MQAQANQAGFQVQIRQIDSTSLITVLRARDFDLCMSPWSGGSDPDGNMFNYFAIEGSNNFPGWRDEETDSLLRRTRATIDQDERGALYRDAQRRIAEAAPILFLTFPAVLQASVAAVRWPQYPDGALRLQFATMG
jgi:peptide/nickel transport system substrate-binding protein